jgi:glycosyltransferase involved in cell wall biosynthesis
LGTAYRELIDFVVAIRLLGRKRGFVNMNVDTPLVLRARGKTLFLHLPKNVPQETAGDLEQVFSRDTMPSKHAVDVVVPVYNEEACVEEFYARVARLGFAESLVFVDNASTDRTLAILEQCSGVRIFRHQTNEGYGASIRDGLAASQAECVIIIDADLEYPPEAIPELLAALNRQPVVYGSRFLGTHQPDMPLFRRVGNRVISAAFNCLFRQHTTDIYTGMKGLRREAIRTLDLRQNGFEHVVELGAQLARAGYTIAEIPVTYTPRSRGVSKMRHIPETLKYVWYVTGYWFRYILLRRPVGSPAL